MSLFPDVTQLVFGSRHTKPNLRRVISFTPDLVGGLTPGKKGTVQRKLAGNEDAMGFHRRAGNLELLILADSHFGNMAGDFVVAHFLEYFERVRGPIPLRLFAAHMDLDAKIREEKPHLAEVHPACATTLISVCLQGGQIFFCNTGDSRLFLMREGRLLELMEIQENLFVGDSYYHLAQIYPVLEELGFLQRGQEQPKALQTVFELTRIHRRLRSGGFEASWAKAILDGIAEKNGLPLSTKVKVEELATPWHPLHLMIAKTLPAWGELEPHPGDALFLATDGIEEEVSGLAREEVAAIVCNSGTSLEKRAAMLLKKCLGKHGGHDNLMFMIRENLASL